MKLIPTLFLALASLLLIKAAQACPTSVAALKTNYLPEGQTLCEIYDDYHAVLSELKTKGVAEPEFIANVIAPRFINLSDWLRKRESVNFDPWPIYSAKTWGSWLNANSKLNALVSANLNNQTIAPVSTEDLLKFHRIAMSQLLPDERAGVLRTGLILGRAYQKKVALLFGQGEVINQLEYKSILNPGHTLASWHPTACWDDQDASFKQAHRFDRDQDKLDFLDVDPSTHFLSEDGTKKQCGYIEYAAYEEIAPQLDRWSQAINANTSTWYSSNPQGDVLLTAARAQRWFVSIHPFADGNGRMSRFMMEYVLMSAGLPTPIFSNMDDDLGTAEIDWAKKIGEGMLDTLKNYHRCANDLTAAGCNVTRKRF